MPINPRSRRITSTDLTHGRQRILVGDVLSQLRTLPDDSVQCCVTSPPYWGLRDYGVEGQIGSEKTPEEFVARMVEVFREVHRTLRPDATLWLNLGDSYATQGGSGRQGKTGQRADRRFTAERSSEKGVPLGLKPKDLVGIPWRVAFALQADGWWLRQDIIWHKPNPMPSSVTDRCTTAHEYLFLLTKSDRYYFDSQAIRVPHAATSLSRAKTESNPRTKSKGAPRQVEARVASLEWKPDRIILNEHGANKRDVWTISTQSYKGAHFATFPELLVEPCILAGTSERGCCSKCGTPYRRQVVSERVPTRPGRDTKVEGTTSDVSGNRDPERHVTTKHTVGWDQMCECEGHMDAGFTIHPADTEPCTVLDPFCGSGTTLTVAEHHGRKGIGIELNPEYAHLAIERIKAGCKRVGKAEK